MEFKINIDDAVLAQAFCSAIEGGGISHWSRSVCRFSVEPVESYHPKETDMHCYYQPLLDDGWIRFVESNDESMDPPVAYKLTKFNLEQGIRKMASDCPSQLAALLADEVDAWTGDVLVQCCLFGEVRYT